MENYQVIKSYPDRNIVRQNSSYYALNESEKYYNESSL